MFSHIIFIHYDSPFADRDFIEKTKKADASNTNVFIIDEAHLFVAFLLMLLPRARLYTFPKFSANFLIFFRGLSGRSPTIPPGVRVGVVGPQLRLAGFERRLQ